MDAHGHGAWTVVSPGRLLRHVVYAGFSSCPGGPGDLECFRQAGSGPTGVSSGSAGGVVAAQLWEF